VCGKQNVAHATTTFFTIESPVISVVGGEVVRGENCTCEDGMDREVWTSTVPG